MTIPYLCDWLVSSPSHNNIDQFQKKTKFYWSLLRLLVAILCFRLNARHDVIRASLIFVLVILELVTSKLQSRTKANLMIGAIYLLKLWIGSQIKENSLWLVPFSMFLQVNLYMHGVPIPMLIGSIVTSLFFISSVEASFYSGRFDYQSLDTMFSSLFKGYKVLSFNLMMGLIIMNYLFINTLKTYANTELKLKEAQARLSDAVLKHEYMLSTLDQTNSALMNATRQLKATKSELESTSRELEELLKADDMLLTSISHELRNPLNSIIGNIELLLLEIKVPKYQEMLGISKICSETLLTLINNLLDIAKIKSARLELSPAPTKILELLAKIWKMNATKIAKKGLQGALYISTNIPNKLIIDSHRLMQILLNLLDNAVKFTKKGKVEVYVKWVREWDYKNDFLSMDSKLHSIPSFGSYQNLAIPKELYLRDIRSISGNETDEKSVHEPSLINLLPKFKSNFISDLDRVCYRKFETNNTEIEKSFNEIFLKKSSQKGITDKGYLQIEVIDTGCGIDPEIHSRLFKPFMKGDSSITRDYGGLGLGLFITKHLLEKMGGDISTKSEKNKGTNFCIKIPCIIKDDNSSNIPSIERVLESSEIIRARSMMNTIRVLVVDDNPYNQVVLQSFLKKMDIESETADNGLKAFEMMKNNPQGYYSFIFMDLQMPLMDGLTACRVIRNYEAEKQVSKPIPIIIITGNASDYEKEQCLNPNGGIRASSFFRKPFTFSECQICVEHLINDNKNFQYENNKILANSNTTTKV